MFLLKLNLNSHSARKKKHSIYYVLFWNYWLKSWFSHSDKVKQKKGFTKRQNPVWVMGLWWSLVDPRDGNPNLLESHTSKLKMCNISLLMFLVIFLFWLQSPQCDPAVMICGEWQTGSPVPTDQPLRRSRSRVDSRPVGVPGANWGGTGYGWPSTDQHITQGGEKKIKVPPTPLGPTGHVALSPTPPPHHHLTHTAPALPRIKAAIDPAQKNRWREREKVCVCVAAYSISAAVQLRFLL